MSFFTNRGNPIIDSAIHNANWIISNCDFQNRIAEYDLSDKIFPSYKDDTSFEIILFNPLPFTRKNNLLSYKDQNSPLTLFVNKNKLNHKPEKIAIALINEFLNNKQDFNFFDDYLINNSNSVVSTIVEDLISKNKIIVF